MCEAGSEKEKFFLHKGKDYILMGLGNRWRGDDGVGSFIAENFHSDDWYVLDCGTAPENFLSFVEKNRPRYLVVVDTAQMNLEPGEFRVIPPEKIFDLPPHEVNDAGFEWVNDRYFYCKKCQRDLGCDQVDEC